MRRDFDSDNGSKMEDCPPLPCGACGKLTQRVSLSQHGARCLGCFEAYCRETKPFPAYDKRTGGARAWAHALKAQEESGDRLTPAQKAMWRSALRPHGLPEAVEA